jgi:hypothetical protein
MTKQNKTWPFGPGHRPIRGWLMSQDPAVDAECLGSGVYEIMDRTNASRYVVAFGQRRAVCSCDDHRRVRRPQAMKTAGGHDADCAHVWMLRFRRGDFTGAEPPLELRTHPIREAARA